MAVVAAAADETPWTDRMSSFFAWLYLPHYHVTAVVAAAAAVSAIVFAQITTSSRLLRKFNGMFLRGEMFVALYSLFKVNVF